MDESNVRLAVMPYIDKLAAFDTAEGIREFFAAEGVKARVGNGTDCAIAQYVWDGSGRQVYVGRYDVMCLIENSKQVTLFGNTAAMQDFIGNFDCGRYPELVVK